MAEEWLVERDAEQLGPLTTEALKQLAATGQLKPTDRVRKGGMPRFVPAGSVRGLFPKHAPSPAAGRPATPPAQRNLASGDAPSSARRGAAEAPRFPANRIVLGGVAAGILLVVVIGVTAVVVRRDRTGPAASPAAAASVDSPAGRGASAGGGPVAATAAATPPPASDATNTSALTADEILLLRLASRLRRRDPLKPTGNEKSQLLIRQFSAGGRGMRLAFWLFKHELISQSLDQASEEFARELPKFPDKMRGLAIQSVVAGLSNEEGASPFSGAVRGYTGDPIEWFDDLRRNRALQAKLELELAKTYIEVSLAVWDDLTPALGKAEIPVEHLQLQAGPFGQIMSIRYVGTEPLTNVVFLGSVAQGEDLSGRQHFANNAIDLFNAAFGATEGQRKDAQTIFRATQEFENMPKLASGYTATLAPQEWCGLTIGTMPRGKAGEKNWNAVAMYCDQGRIEFHNARDFPPDP